MTDSNEAKYGLWVVLAGLAVLLIAFVVAVFRWSSAGEVAAVLGAMSGVIGTIVGAFFGVQVGEAGKQKIEAQRDKAFQQIRELIAALPADRFEKLRQDRPQLFSD